SVDLLLQNAHIGPHPSLPLRVLTSLPDLTLGAIALRRFAPETPGRYRSQSRPHDDRNLKKSTPRKKIRRSSLAWLPPSVVWFQVSSLRFQEKQTLSVRHPQWC